MQGQSNPALKPAARSLRSNMTDAERLLWQRLRSNQLGARFRRQHPFQHYMLDFVCLEHKLVVEADGSQHMEAAAYDTQRTQTLQAAGFRLLRFWNHDILNQTEAVMEAIYLALHGKQQV
ncbi:Very-short-patch-repair endonuclease [Noviherbaspirillum humi]|uniref:Very-short-patch-repair endonuclease n=1 Tax=Noviherbaspirillum humi TaxID=1688639 RepID=A0A239BVG2_9BURK|nr:DUF559 domain-containing protein [Noviherbaspirillum humi]SNS11143.1 Very-short-patch-repair endonuclease [Noviherbaspirillum humi]